MRDGAGGETILVVEDAEAVRKLVCAMLSNGGYQCLEAGDGHEALQLVEDSPQSFRLVLTDIVMPGMSGVELARHLSRIRPELRVVFMSGYADDPLMDKIDRGALLLSKPFTAAALLDAIRHCLSGDSGGPPTSISRFSF
jgi:two-component system, cell cycle sensor histidine kinase and response regulator CckA